MIIVRRRRVFTGIAIARANKRDNAGDDGADKRQDDDGFVHLKARSVRVELRARSIFSPGA